VSQDRDDDLSPVGSSSAHDSAESSADVSDGDLSGDVDATGTRRGASVIRKLTSPVRIARAGLDSASVPVVQSLWDRLGRVTMNKKEGVKET
jgi:hypothetical protein